MRIRNTVLSIFVLAWLSGCATAPQKTLAELDAALTQNETASIRLYPGKNASEVRKAAHQVLYLLDPKDIVFDIHDDGLMATRWSTFYAIFYTGFGRDWYSVDLEETTEGVIAKFGFTGVMSVGLFTTPIPGSFQKSIPVSAYQNQADFTLFHNRVEYLLGMREEWPTCADIKNSTDNIGNDLFLCDSLGLENKPPSVS